MMANWPKYYENRKLYIIDLISQNNCVDGSCTEHYEIVTGFCLRHWGQEREHEGRGTCGAEKH
jgi:hypothetical protein